MIAYLTVLSGFTLIGFIAGNIWIILFFGILAIGKTYQLLSPKNKVIFLGSKEEKEFRRKEFEDKYNDNSIFSYNENGFEIKLEDALKTIAWTDIISMIGYKKDIEISA